jgi:hypothetical protein
MDVVKKIVFFLLLFIFIINFVNAECNKKNNSFAIGENLQYIVYYNWGFIWVNAGTAFFKVSDAIYKGNFVYKLESGGSSLQTYDWIYKVRDYFVSYTDKTTLLPLVYKRNTSEGSYKVENNFVFDYNQNIISTKLYNSKDGHRNKIVDLTPCVHDLVSAVYHLRNINFDDIELDEIVPISTIVDGEIFDIYIRYKGVEVVEISHLNEKYNCLKFTVKLIEGTIFNEGENMTVWVTKDANRIPVMVEAKILVGSIKVFIDKKEGLKNRETSLVID